MGWTVIRAVPPVITELVLALHQPLPRAKRNGPGTHRTTADHYVPHRTTVDHYVSHRTMADHYVPHRTTADHCVPHRTTVDHYVPHRITADHYVPHRTTADHYVPHRTTADHYVPTGNGRSLLAKQTTVDPFVYLQWSLLVIYLQCIELNILHNSRKI